MIVLFNSKHYGADSESCLWTKVESQQGGEASCREKRRCCGK